MDARKFVVGNVAPIGCIPYQKSINQLKDKQCVDLANKLALQYNARLKDLLMVELKDSLKDAHFVYANVYDLVMDLIVNYKEYGMDISGPWVFKQRVHTWMFRFFYSKNSILPFLQFTLSSYFSILWFSIKL